MPRSIWNGAIVFGTVTVPVKVFAATERHTVHFNEVHAKDGAQIEHRKVSSKSGREVKDIVKGYETSAGKYVVLEPDEIKALQAPSRKAIRGLQRRHGDGHRCRARGARAAAHADDRHRGLRR